jgi:hypothetical protein
MDSKSTNSSTSTLCTSTFIIYQEHHDPHGHQSKSEIELQRYKESGPRNLKLEVLEPSTDADDQNLREEYEQRMDEVLKLVNARAGYLCRESDLPKSLDLPASIQEIVLSLAIAIPLNDGKDMKEGFGPLGRLEVTAETWIDTMSEEPFVEFLGIIDLLEYLRRRSRWLDFGCGCLMPLWDGLVNCLMQFRWWMQRQRDFRRLHRLKLKENVRKERARLCSNNHVNKLRL